MVASEIYAESSEDGETFRYTYSDEGKKAELEARQRILTVDPDAQFDYTDTTYWVVETELVDQG